MNVTRTTLLIGFVCAAFAIQGASGQSFTPEYNPLYDDTRVATIRVELLPAHLDTILSVGNEESDVEYPATFTYNDGTTVETVENVGFRLRGNTSRYAEKRSFKVAFNAFTSGGKFMGVEKLNLNGEHNDPSIIRSKLSWDLFQAQGVAAPRSAHVRLFINDVYYGLYANVEHIDEQFLQSRFGGDSGFLYKCLWPADLSYLGPTADSYRPDSPDRRPYDLKLRDSDQEGYHDLAHLIDVLNNTALIDFKREIEKVFDVNGFLRSLAIDVVTGSWDNYWYLKNNFYLYNNPNTGLFHYIPYDFDNTFGIWWDGIEAGIDWGTRNVYDWGNLSESRPLADRIFDHAEYRDRFSFFLQEVVDKVYIAAQQKNRVDVLHALVTEAAEADTFRTRDYGYSIDDFHDSFSTAQGDHVTYGIKPFIDTRHASALSQILPVEIDPILLDAFYEPVLPSSAEPIHVVVTMIDDGPGVVVTAEYTVDGDMKLVELHDDGAHGDGMAGDGRFGGYIPPTEETVDMTLTFSARQPDGGRSATSPRTIRVGFDGPPLFINELMASNDATIADEFGEYDDWAELYNGGNDPISLGGLYLTDNLTDPHKWAFPDTTIGPGEFVIVWLDDDAQGPMHATFKLSAGGEQLGIFSADASAVDALSFGEQTTDVSFGRTLDGAGRFEHQSLATPGTPNMYDVATETIDALSRLTVAAFPVPSSGPVNLAVEGGSGVVIVEVVDLLGRRVGKISNTDPSLKTRRLTWDGMASGVPVQSGVYFIRAVDESGRTASTSVVIARTTNDYRGDK